jgi:23S rRNA (guanosine2251-2'-O)-methyltransferase
MKQYLYGKQPVLLRLEQKKVIQQLYVLDNPSHFYLVDLAKQHNIPVQKCSNKQLDQLSDGNHQGVIALIPPYQSVSLEKLLESTTPSSPGFLIMLDGITDPHNLGAILRTADAVGAHGVIIKKYGSVGLTSTVAKVSAGAIESVPVAIVTNLTQTLDTLKDKGYWVVGTDMENAVYYREVDYTSPIVIVVGSEGDGISKLVKKQCDHMVSLPMVGSVSSLNVSVATGVLLYEVFDQRRG